MVPLFIPFVGLVGQWIDLVEPPVPKDPVIEDHTRPRGTCVFPDHRIVSTTLGRRLLGAMGEPATPQSGPTPPQQSVNPGYEEIQ